MQVSHADTGGGAAVAAYRLHAALRRDGVASSMLVGGRATSDDDVAALRTSPLLRRPLRLVTREMGLNELDGLAAYTMARREDVERADVLHFHAIHGGYFSYPAMPALTRRKPSVLTLHDMWPLTGHCGFSFECQRWRDSCGRCPHPEAFPAIRRDATRVELALKRQVWSRSPLTIVSPSAWLAGIARESILGHLPIVVIPHGIDSDAYAPRGRAASRSVLGLDQDDPVVLFAATSAADPRKGGDLFGVVLAGLPAAVRARTTVLLMGASGSRLRPALRELGHPVTDAGFVASDQLKSILYSAADVFVFPTRADNSPLVVLESLACGTPVATFDVGGVGELVADGVTGVLAPPEHAAGLTSGLERLIEDRARRDAMGAAARAAVVARHSEQAAVRDHRALYEQVLAERHRAAR